MSWETVAVVQVRDDGGLVQLSSNAVGEKWSHSTYILHVESIQFVDGVNVGCQGKGEVKSGSQCFLLE